MERNYSTLGPVKMRAVTTPGPKYSQKKTYFQNPEESPLEGSLQVRTLGTRRPGFQLLSALRSLGVVPGSTHHRELEDEGSLMEFLHQPPG